MTVPPRPGYKQVVVGVEIVESERVWDPEAGVYLTRSASAETEVRINALVAKIGRFRLSYPLSRLVGRMSGRLVGTPVSC